MRLTLDAYLLFAFAVAIKVVAGNGPEPSPAPPLQLVKRQSLSPADKSQVISEISGYLTDPAFSASIVQITKDPQLLSSLSEEYVSLFGTQTGTYALNVFTSLLAEAQSTGASQAAASSSASGSRAETTVMPASASSASSSDNGSNNSKNFSNGGHSNYPDRLAVSSAMSLTVGILVIALVAL